jgi:hypothetical protein
MNGFRKIFPSFLSHYATFFAKMAERKVVPFDKFYYQLKLTHLFQKHLIYIKMNRRSLVSLKLKNGLTDLNIYFFLLFPLIQGWFKKKNFLEKLTGKLENSGKTESTFFYGNGWNDLANFFFMFVIIRMWLSCKEKLEKLPGKLENSEKTESDFCDGYA